METINETTTSSESTQQDSGAGTQPEIKGSVHQASGVREENNAGTPGTAGEAAQATEAAINQYTPNFKFKVNDKELEIDDFLKPIVKNKDVETKLREIYEKAHGIDAVKTAREQFKKQAEEWQGKYTTVETSLQSLGQMVKKGDYRTFFDVLNIPKQDIINYAIQELKYQELPPEQRQAIDAEREREIALSQTSQQNQMLQQQMAQMVQQQAQFELNQELAAPTVAQVITAYDTRAGKPGAFRAEVIRRGQYYEAVHKISPPASQLVQEVLALVGTQQAQPGPMDSSQDSSGQTASSQQQKPVIPSFSGGGTKSPTSRKVPSSIEDLRKMRQNLTT